MKKIFLILILIKSTSIFAQNVNLDNLEDHIEYLASDKLEGRAPGTKGEALAIKYIAKKFKKYGLAPAGTDGFKQTFTYRLSANPHDTTTTKTGKEMKGTNVAGFLDNGATNTIVIGAHFDHLGNGHHTSALDTTSGIHNGADDNASGTAGVIELANYFANNGIKEQNNFLFLCFSAEEDGLVGSKHFTQLPTIALDKINCMINMDMIGRLDNTTKKLLVYGIGTSPAFNGLFNDTQFQYVIDSSGVGPTDHTSFYLKNIPVLSFFTGQHSDYHKMTDDVDKINFEGEIKILDKIVATIQTIDKKGKIPFTTTKQKETGRSKFKVSMGIMPDYTSTVNGLRVDGVTDGKPAQKAGIEAGDIIIEMNGTPIKDVYEYMTMLGKLNKGDEVPVKVKREGVDKTIIVKF